MSAPASPPARRRRVPSWFDLRFVLGVVLVLVSVIGGAWWFAAADRTAPVWAVTRDLGAGTVLAADDVAVVRVRLPENGEQYLGAGGASPVGRSLNRDVGAGELLPRAALIDRSCGSEVSIPVAALHVPATIRRGVKVDVFATPREGRTTRVLAAVTVQDAVRGSDLGGGSALVVRVADSLAPEVVSAVRTAEIDVVVVSGSAPGDGCGAPPPTRSPGPTPSNNATLPSDIAPSVDPGPSTEPTPSLDDSPPIPTTPEGGGGGVAPRVGARRSGAPGGGGALRSGFGADGGAG
ncbi:SAF domain-containing protein [Cryptosporangium sp. NPDC048952]|uniref:SAF domain-containing protein n=1 Tax=Cryptosporangium sp. NPDC048952 TaxID=3363961 RepID=UPI0037201F99